MKRKMTRALALALALSLIACVPALAVTTAGQLVVRRAAAYSDAEMTKKLGTIPAWTAVEVVMFPLDTWEYSHYDVACVRYAGRWCFIKSSKLMTPDIFTAYDEVTLKKGRKVYQRPTPFSASVTLKRNRKVAVCAIRGDWALINSDAQSVEGKYGFVFIG